MEESRQGFRRFVRPSAVRAAFPWVVLILVVGGAQGLFLGYVLPALWGPYALAFLDAGPLFCSRLGAMWCSMMPCAVLVGPLAQARSFGHWFVLQGFVLVLAAASYLSFGYYAHTIVHNQGVDQSLAVLAMEVGFDSVDSIPAHIKEAFALSGKLASEGTPPWLPMAWKSVAWPVIPNPL